jgi:hypothetical protein
MEDKIYKIAESAREVIMNASGLSGDDLNGSLSQAADELNEIFQLIVRREKLMVK